ncbi:tetratricopeptide repeat protein [Haliangium sp.]|uniref:tetratricopeptide repeat protein n=1 Tax=Haliangium sp. TaxID=2663208 RepID=UPI003D133C7A
MSPKNKGKFGKGKSEVELEDEFVSGVAQVAEKLKPHMKVIIALSTVMLLAMTGFYVAKYLGERAEAQATELYREAIAAAQRPVVPAVEGEDEAETEDPADDRLPKPFRSRDARFEAILSPLETLRSEHGSTDTGHAARLLHASTLYDAGRYDEAAEMYRAILADDPDPTRAGMAREGLGYAQEAAALAQENQDARAQGLEQALATFRSIQTDDEGPGRELALYHEGRILATLGRRDEAKAALEKAAEIAPDSPLRPDIRQRLAQLGPSAQ